MEAATDGERLARIEALLEGMGATLADVRMEQHRTAERIGRLDERIDRVAGRIDGLNRRIDRALEQRGGLGRWRRGIVVAVILALIPLWARLFPGMPPLQ